MVRCACGPNGKSAGVQLMLYRKRGYFQCVLCGVGIPGPHELRRVTHSYAPAELVAAFRVGGLTAVDAYIAQHLGEHEEVRRRLVERLIVHERSSRSTGDV